MKNPWEEINLSDYENHMKLDKVMQLQAMNKMMKEQFYKYPVKTIMILGVAGGNGLEHIDAQIIERIYGVDINKKYLQECAARYEKLNGILECFCVDLSDENTILPYADIVIANLLVEYIGYECFKKVITQIKPKYVSCIIQINIDDSFVSDSPYLHVFEHLDIVHHHMEEDELVASMENISYQLLSKSEYFLPNGKKLVQIDFQLKAYPKLCKPLLSDKINNGGFSYGKEGKESHEAADRGARDQRRRRRTGAGEGIDRRTDPGMHGRGTGRRPRIQQV